SRLQTRLFEFQYVTRIPAVRHGAGKLRLWIPVPESDSQQKISGLTIESPVGYEVHRDPEYGNRYVYLELDRRAGTAPVEVRLRFRAERREHRVAPDTSAGSAGAGQRQAAELARFLQPDRLVPIDGVIAALAAQETRGRERPLEKARAIYNYVISTIRYDKSGEGWGRGDAIYACTVRKGNCSDFHALFIGMMRASGIPARFEIGFPLPPDKAAGDIGGYHCWAQFYLEGVGWVPVDASEAWKNPAKRDYFFGAHDPHRVLFTRGRDIRFNPAQQGEPLNYFIYPYAELDGKPFSGVESKFSFRDLESKNP
ncbi:MAG: transglutaminase-like domain-containing protein, partial [Gemmatimonadales bacterium]